MRTNNKDSSSIILPLPHDIVMAILLLLPLKALLRCMSVSKSWLAFFSNPDFVKFHLHSSIEDKKYSHHRVLLNFQGNIKDCSLRSLLYSPITDTFDMDYPMRNSHSGSYLGSANGLICVATREKYNASHIMTETFPSEEVHFYIWNPSIRRSKKLPDSGVTTLASGSDCFSKYGFGYDELHDDYKLVVIYYIFAKYPSYDTKVRIYSLKMNSWRTIPEDFQGISRIDCLGKYVNGKIYWTSRAGVRGHNAAIVSFDLAYETWGEVEQPNYGQGKFSLMLGVLGSDLSVVCNYEKTHSDVWVMKDNYGVKAYWKKMFTISCYDDPERYAYYPLPRSPVTFSPPFFKLNKGEILVMFQSVFMIYNPKYDSIKRLNITGIEYYFEAEIYVESLVNPLALSIGDGEDW